MCPFCVLTAVAVASGSISAGGVGAIFISKARAKHAVNLAGIGHESRLQKKSNPLPTREPGPLAACQELFITDEASCDFRSIVQKL